MVGGAGDGGAETGMNGEVGLGEVGSGTVLGGFFRGIKGV